MSTKQLTVNCLKRNDICSELDGPLRILNKENYLREDRLTNYNSYDIFKIVIERLGGLSSPENNDGIFKMGYFINTLSNVMDKYNNMFYSPRGWWHNSIVDINGNLVNTINRSSEIDDFNIISSIIINNNITFGINNMAIQEPDKIIPWFLKNETREIDLNSLNLTLNQFGENENMKIIDLDLFLYRCDFQRNPFSDTKDVINKEYNILKQIEPLSSEILDQKQREYKTKLDNEIIDRLFCKNKDRVNYCDIIRNKKFKNKKYKDLPYDNKVDIIVNDINNMKKINIDEYNSYYKNKRIINQVSLEIALEIGYLMEDISDNNIEELIINKWIELDQRGVAGQKLSDSDDTPIELFKNFNNERLKIKKHFFEKLTSVDTQNKDESYYYLINEINRNIEKINIDPQYIKEEYKFYNIFTDKTGHEEDNAYKYIVNKIKYQNKMILNNHKKISYKVNSKWFHFNRDKFKLLTFDPFTNYNNINPVIENIFSEATVENLNSQGKWMSSIEENNYKLLYNLYSNKIDVLIGYEDQVINGLTMARNLSEIYDNKLPTNILEIELSHPLIIDHILVKSGNMFAFVTPYYHLYTITVKNSGFFSMQYIYGNDFHMNLCKEYVKLTLCKRFIGDIIDMYIYKYKCSLSTDSLTELYSLNEQKLKGKIKREQKLSDKTKQMDEPSKIYLNKLLCPFCNNSSVDIFNHKNQLIYYCNNLNCHSFLGSRFNPQ